MSEKRYILIIGKSGGERRKERKVKERAGEPESAIMKVW